jgi:hypothetical protein
MSLDDAKNWRARFEEQVKARARHEQYEHHIYPMQKTDDRRDFPVEDAFICNRKAVCKRCHVVMKDCEPMSGNGEFYHPSEDKDGKPHWCRNSDKYLTVRDLELEPFLPKARRRALQRMGIRP